MNRNDRKNRMANPPPPSHTNQSQLANPIETNRKAIHITSHRRMDRNNRNNRKAKRSPARQTQQPQAHGSRNRRAIGNLPRAPHSPQANQENRSSLSLCRLSDPPDRTGDGSQKRELGFSHAQMLVNHHSTFYLNLGEALMYVSMCGVSGVGPTISLLCFFFICFS